MLQVSAYICDWIELVDGGVFVSTRTIVASALQIVSVVWSHSAWDIQLYATGATHVLNLLHTSLDTYKHIIVSVLKIKVNDDYQ